MFSKFRWLSKSLSLTTRKAANNNQILRSSSSLQTLKKNIPAFDRLNSLRFDDARMQEKLTPKVYKSFKDSIKNGTALEKQEANEVAHALMTWAVENGCTNYAHWYHPIRGSDGRAASAMKYDGFIELDFAHSDNLKPIVCKKMSGSLLFIGETDGSSYPSGGLRATHTAAAFVSWDKSSPPFIRDDTLFLPCGFISHSGHALDHKIPLLRAQEAINTEGLRLLRLLGDKTAKEVVTNVGPEQEYFLVDHENYLKRPDLQAAGRTLFGALPARNQERSENYFAQPNRRAKAFMSDLQTELWAVGISALCNHNEVAPSQHELSPIFSITNVSADQNQLMMELMDSVAAKHGLKVLFHEKPFAGVNGSGKHNNWGLNTDTGKNLFSPGKTDDSQRDFTCFVAALAYAIAKHGDVIRAAVATPGNDHRLGAQEAPPAVISLYTGNLLLAHLKSVIAGGALHGYGTKTVKEVSFGAKAMQNINISVEDRNRTAPFPFCGNRFEFRAVGSAQNIAQPLAFINAAMADGCAHLSKLIEGGLSVRDAVAKVLSENEYVIFNGNGYEKDWPEQAVKRGMLNLPTCVDAWRNFDSTKNLSLFKRMGVLSEEEVKARRLVALSEYTHTIMIEARTAIDMTETGFIPACASDLNLYSGEPAKKLAGNREAVYNRVRAACVVLKQAVENFSHDSEELEQAEYCLFKVKPCLTDLRDRVDAAEGLVADHLWPFPKYQEILFGHHSE